MNLKYSELLQLGPIGSGRTHAICEAAKTINATVIVSNGQHARKLVEKHGVAMIVLGPDMDRFKGFTGPYLLDHGAMLKICEDYEFEIGRLQIVLSELKETINAVT